MTRARTLRGDAEHAGLARATAAASVLVLVLGLGLALLSAWRTPYFEIG